MVATLNPIRTHIMMKTGRLLGTQATVMAAGMKSWEGRKRFQTECRKTTWAFRIMTFLSSY